MQIDPLNIQGLHNLCVVFVERGKLTQALDCLQHAHKLAPQEDYILKHLKIVQQRLANLKQAPGMHTQKIIAFAKYDPTDFGGVATEASINGNSDEHANLFIPSEGQETISNPNSKTDTEPEIMKLLATGKSNENGNDASNTESLQQSEYIANIGQPKTTSSSSSPQLPLSAQAPSSNQPTIYSENQKHSDESQTSFNTNGLIDQTDQQQIDTNHQHSKQFVQDNSLPTFAHPYVHDTDDPSTGTS